MELKKQISGGHVSFPKEFWKDISKEGLYFTTNFRLHGCCSLRVGNRLSIKTLFCSGRSGEEDAGRQPQEQNISRRCIGSSVASGLDLPNFVRKTRKRLFGWTTCEQISSNFQDEEAKTKANKLMHPKSEKMGPPVGLVSHQHFIPIVILGPTTFPTSTPSG